MRIRTEPSRISQMWAKPLEMVKKKGGKKTGFGSRIACRGTKHSGVSRGRVGTHAAVKERGTEGRELGL